MAVLFSGAVFALRGEATQSTDPTAELPASAESTKVAELQKRLPSGQATSALIVYSRDGRALTEDDDKAIEADRQALGAESPVIMAQDRTAALVAVSLPGDLDGDPLIEAVDRIRAEARAGLPDGSRAQVTGGAGIAADITNSFAGADLNLLLVTVVVVAVLLLITYRSPWLWLVPLTVIGVGDQVAAGILTIVSRTTGLVVSPATSGIASVLVFGAGTNYALLLIARYREELRHAEDRHEAMRRALKGAAPAILSSATTVIVSLLTLVFAVLTSNRNLGIAAAIGIATALCFALVVLPSALLLFGRGLFWPFVPRAGEEDKTGHGLWARVGRGVARRPVVVAVVSLALLGGLAFGVTRIDIGLAQTEQFRTKAESVDGLETLARSFPAGAAEPVVILTTNASADAVVRAAAAVPGVASARIAEATGQAQDAVVRVDAILTAAPGTDDSDTAVRALRRDLDAADPGALVGGSVPIDLDTRDAAARDQLLIAPLILLVVLLVLAIVLRSLVAPLLLLITVVASYFAALGAGQFILDSVFGFPALDYSVPLLSFLFLVALGVDYNIFLTVRAREETLRSDTRAGILTALAVTGGIITSAGVLLAAVFAVLGVIPVTVLTQIGVIVGIGVLLDTLLVRSVLVPAIVLLTGPRFWWPGLPSGDPEGMKPASAESPSVASHR